MGAGRPRGHQRPAADPEDPPATTAGTSLVNQTKTNGALFRQLAVGADIPLADSLKYNSPGLNLATNNPTRVFPDMGQILADNTNAATGRCPTRRRPPATVPVRDPRVLLGVAADDRLGRLPQRPHDDVPPDGA